MSSRGKPNQNFELNFQHDISDQLAKMTKCQLIKLLLCTTNNLFISMEVMSDFQTEFVDLFTAIGSLLSQHLKEQYSQTKTPTMAQMANLTSKTAFEKSNTFLLALVSGLGGKNLNKKRVWQPN